MRAVLAALFGPLHERRFAVRFWDGVVDAPPGGPPSFTLVLRHAGALRRMLLPPNELSLVESYIFGDVDIEGDLEAAADLGDVAASRVQSLGALARLARLLGALPRDPTGETGETGEPAARVRRARRLLGFGRRHAPARDRAAVRFHYDLGNDFYALWLDERMVYSCAYFAEEGLSLDDAQRAKLDLVCRKLRLRPGERLLDIGCGWGGLVIHAARHYGVRALGITLSERQAELARARIAAAGLAGRCAVEVRDYRSLGTDGGPAFDKIASVGMVEHVGLARLPDYFAAAWRALAPGGLFLNHGIVGIAGARRRSLGRRLRDRVDQHVWRRDAFIHRYVFPDGDLVAAAQVLAAADGEGFEVRDVESLREHYTTTLRHWVRRLEAKHAEAAALVGEATFRVWRLYMAASAYGFRTGRIGIIQSLLAKQAPDGAVGLPRTRADLYGEGPIPRTPNVGRWAQPQP